jgi:excisionase family DNA binding protein
MNEELLTVDELAKVLRIHQVSLRRLVAQGKVPVIRVGGALRFDRHEVLQALSTAVA